MADKIEQIGKREILWSYAGTAFMVGAGVLLMPFILHKMPQETVGVWNVFQAITALVFLLDFGFRPTFARNISYIFSGVKTLQKNGVAQTDTDASVDYGLLKGSLQAMRKFYQYVALGVFLLLLTAGSIYFYYVLQKYSGDKTDAAIAWILLIVINCYNLYTFYYDALLIGKGYVKRSQQINMLGQSVYIILAIGLIYTGLGLTAIVAAQATSTILRRILAYRVFFNTDLKDKLSVAIPKEPKAILEAISPNAIKIGLTQLGGFCVNKSAILIGTPFLSLSEIASYGITLQVMDILSRCATVFYQSYMPKLAQCRAERNISQLKNYYVQCIGALWIIFILGGMAWMAFGDWALGIIHSKTPFIPTAMLGVMLLISALEQNHAVSAGFIMADNKIPFFIPSLVSGGVTIILLFVFLDLFNMGIWGMILAPGIAQLAYQNWKWPMMVIKELRNG